MTKEKTLIYHQSLAKALVEAIKHEKSPKKIERIKKELKRSGKEILKDIEDNSFDSENPDRGLIHPPFELLRGY